MDSVYIDVVTSIFMLLFGVNFSIYFLLLMKKFRAALLDSEFLGYFGIALGVSVLIALDIIDEYGGFWNAFRYSLFQVSSLMTTTGLRHGGLHPLARLLQEPADNSHAHRRQRGQHRAAGSRSPA